MYNFNLLKTIKVPIEFFLEFRSLLQLRNQNTISKCNTLRFALGECAVRMARAGADVVGANCLFDPFINLTVLKKMKERLDKEKLSTFLMSQPLGFLCPDGGKYGYCDLNEFPYGGSSTKYVE